MFLCYINVKYAASQRPSGGGQLRALTVNDGITRVTFLSAGCRKGGWWNETTPVRRPNANSIPLPWLAGCEKRGFIHQAGGRSTLVVKTSSGGCAASPFWLWRTLPCRKWSRERSSAAVQRGGSKGLKSQREGWWWRLWWCRWWWRSRGGAGGGLWRYFPPRWSDPLKHRCRDHSSSEGAPPSILHGCTVFVHLIPPIKSWLVWICLFPSPRNLWCADQRGGVGRVSAQG